MTDNIREKIVARAAQMNLTASELAYRCGEAFEPSPDVETIRRFLTGKRAMTSGYISQLCDVLGLELRKVRR